MACTSPNNITYHKLDKPCECGRQPDVNENGCGRCIGRGKYIYPHIYEDCDCGGYEKI